MKPNPTIKAMLRLARLMDRHRDALDALRDHYRAGGPGKQDGVTVYRVRACKVRAYRRKAFVAVRIRRS